MAFFEKPVTELLPEYTRVIIKDGTGLPLIEAKTISLNRNMNTNPLFSVHSGYAGESVGSGIITINVQSALPISGIEGGQLFENYLITLNNTTLTITLENDINRVAKVLQFKGQILEDTIRYSVNDHAAHDFSARGKLAVWQ